MKTAIEIPGSTHITPKQFKELVGYIGKSVDNWNFGNVDVCSSHDWVTATFENTLSQLNSLGSQYEIRSPCWKAEKPALLFGRGSIGPHKDGVNGLSILTFLGSFCPEEDMDEFHPNIPQYHHRDGEFFQGKFIEMKQGDSILFDDDENHAWISNAYWIFASVPDKKLPKPRPSTRKSVTKTQTTIKSK